MTSNETVYNMYNLYVLIGHSDSHANEMYCSNMISLNYISENSSGNQQFNCLFAVSLMFN